MPVTPFARTGTAPEDTSWTWDAETQNAVLGDDSDWDRYKSAHTWWDGETGAKSHYKLPHHAMVDGELSAVFHGVSAAMARLSQSDIPEGDMKGAFDHLASHYAQWDKEPPEWDRWIAGVRERWQRAVVSGVGGVTTRSAPTASPPAGPTASGIAASASILPRMTGRAAALPLVATRAPISVTAARPGGAPTDDDLARINALARSPLDASGVYVFPAEISNQSVDAYYTRMTPKSLTQFAQDASRGVAVCDSHQHYQLPIGRSFYGMVVTDPADGGMATQSLAYMLRGMRTPTGMSTDDIIRGIEGGVNADVSIGFIPVAYWCSICHCDMLNDWDCMHWPGNTYEVKNPDTGVVSEVLCIADVDASLAEYSLVYDGATPNAMVLKAEAALDSGRMTPEMARQIRLVEDHCRVKLVDRWNGFGAGFGAGFGSSAHIKQQPAQQPVEPSAQQHEEGDGKTMRGSEFISEFISRYIEAATAEATRTGKQVSQKNIDRLSAMSDKLTSGHDTMDEAMRELASFIDDVSSGAGGDTDGDGDNPAGGDDSDADGRHAPEAVTETRSVSAVEVRADGSHDAFTGAHTHSHSAFGSQGDDATHEHEHSHDGDASHDHVHTENAASGVELRTAPATAPATGIPNEGIEIPVADGQMRVATLEPVAAETTIPAPADGMSAEQRAVFELGQRVLRDAQDEALQWAVRAGVVQSPEDEQRYRAMFARCSFDDVSTFRVSWEQIAKANLSPRGTWAPDSKAPGGGRWTDAPTYAGGRQTAAADPNDPQRLSANARRVGGGASGLGSGGPGSLGSASALGAPSSRASDDTALYTVGRSKQRARTATRGK